MKIGIIPAGGKATRWNSFPKELASIGATWTLLDRVLLLHTRALADRVIIMSSDEKRPLHQWWVNDHKKWPNVSVMAAESVAGAIKLAIDSNGEADWLFSMPDTYTDNPLFPEELDKPLMLGVFQTERPERFGMLRDGQIVDKQPGGPGIAWGAFMFNKDVASFWRDNTFLDHTHMLNRALEEFEWSTWEIKLYHDVASFQDYLELLGGMYAEK